jgi:hypothetical protein
MGMWRRSSLQTSRNQRESRLPCPTTSMWTCITTWLLEDPLLPSSTSSIKPKWIGTWRNKLLLRLLLLVQNSLLRGLLSIRSSTSERLFVISAFLFEKRATSLETTRPLSMPRWPHMPNYTRDITLYHSIVYERQSLPNMLRSSICRANTTLPTFSANTGPMLWYGKPWTPFYLLEEIHGIF